MDFLLVIPAFEESLRLPKYLDALAAALENQPFDCKILVVDDGSSPTERESMVQAIRNVARLHPGVLDPILMPENGGKGAAIMTGWAANHQARWRAFVDADGAIPPYEVVRVLKMVKDAGDADKSYFASRVKMLGRTIHRDLKRHLMGRIFASLVGCFIDSRVYDSQCGFKVISSHAFETVHEFLVEKRFAFDVELMTALLHAGYPIEEVPIDWFDVPGSKVSIVRDTFKMLGSLERIRVRKKTWMFSK